MVHAAGPASDRIGALAAWFLRCLFSIFLMQFNFASGISDGVVFLFLV